MAVTAAVEAAAAATKKLLPRRGVACFLWPTLDELALLAAVQLAAATSQTPNVIDYQ